MLLRHLFLQPHRLLGTNSNNIITTTINNNHTKLRLLLTFQWRYQKSNFPNLLFTTRTLADDAKKSSSAASGTAATSTGGGAEKKTPAKKDTAKGAKKKGTG